MGLDTGFNLKIKDPEAFGPLPSWIEYKEWEKEGNYPPEILYWRKCWNIRSVIHNSLIRKHGFDGEAIEGTSTDLTLDVAVDVAKEISSCLTKQWWNENDQSIWTWEEVGKSYKSDMKYAMKVFKWLKTKDPNSYVIEYYDSY